MGGWVAAASHPSPPPFRYDCSNQGGIKSALTGKAAANVKTQIDWIVKKVGRWMGGPLDDPPWLGGSGVTR